MQAKPPLKIVLCSPRGFCAGVVRAIDTVERALDHLWRPGLCPPRDRPQPLRGRQPARPRARFSSRNWPKSPTIPTRRWCFRPTACRNRCRPTPERRNFFSLDATCPLVTKVHREAAIHFKRGREILLIGHSHHPEVVGTLGQLPPGAVTLIETAEDARDLHAEGSRQPRLRDPDHAVDRRHRRDRRDAEGALPEHRRPAQGRHLLRHHQPPARGEEGGAGGRRPDRGRRAELVELAAAARSRRARGLPGRGAGAARRRSRLGACSTASRASASPPARRRRK